MSSMCLVGTRPSAMQPPCARLARTDANSSQNPLWRPWLFTSTNQRTRNPLASAEPRPTPDCSSAGRKLCFQHPVRLYWPRSKSYDHLFSDGEALLKNFPVQATISFYDSESEDSEDESEEQDTWME
ncbi:protein ripply1-like [Takifugu rubripes]|uniref:Protein ripply1-like n=1 Tax=Takifugu rubripes TaxID=31033 RepID=A0A674PLR4_TAKRU|nr:protein ripply1-like [Takifugu rubripes]